MNLLEAIILGALQGLTEFIPVSSSGHLTIIPYLFGWATPSLIFDTAVHLGTLLALITFYRHDLYSYAKSAVKLLQRSEESNDDRSNILIIIRVVIATIPAAIIGFLLKDVLENIYKLGDASATKTAIQITAITLILVGILFVVIDRIPVKIKTFELHKITLPKALIIGFAQSIALLRGVSRSGVTVLTGRIMGINLATAAQFSFLMSIPIMTLTSVYGIYKLLKLSGAELQAELAPAILGMIVAYLSGIFAIGFMLRVLRANGLKGFGVYRICFGIFVLMLLGL